MTRAILAVGCRYAAGARKGNSGCDERSTVSPALMRSIATSECKPLVEESGAQLGRAMGDCLPRTVACIRFWGRRGSFCGKLGMTRVRKLLSRTFKQLSFAVDVSENSTPLIILSARRTLLGTQALDIGMSYNYGAPPGAYGGRQPSYGAPGIAPPGMDAPPAAQNQFQPPTNIPPGINFNAPVIRLGVDQPNAPTADRGSRDGRGNADSLGGNSRRAGLGADGGSRNLERDRAQIRESMLAIQQPTREEVARTIFVGGIGNDAPEDEAIENILRCAGKLRRWTRARDADDKKCKFGFAEYEDVDSLEAANELFGDGIEVPAFKARQVIRHGENNEVKFTKLTVIVDEQSQKYIEEWTSKRNEDEDARQFRLDGCKEDLRQCLTSLTNADAFMANSAANGEQDGSADESNAEKKGGDSAEVVNITLNGQGEDDLADVPEDMRATVAAEILAFRDRSNRRDLDRLRQEEEMEQKERQRAMGSRLSRLSSPPRGTPNDGIPSGPRDRTAGPSGAPSGPKGYRSVQMPSDYANGVGFVGANGAGNGISLNREDEDAEESDEELEARRRKKREDELEKQYLDQERKWLNRERVSASARQRDRDNEARSKEQRDRQKDAMIKRLREWNDDEENRLGHEEYYVDRSAWLRKRAAYRDNESRRDDSDRANEMREQSDQQVRDAEARGQADAFLDQLDSELTSRSAAEPAGPGKAFKLNLGAAKNKASAATTGGAGSRRTVAELEGLLEDEEGRRKTALKPLTDTSTLPTNGADLSDEDRAAARQQLAGEIPTDTEALFAYKVRWSSLSSENIETQIRPMVEKKVVEYLGVQEELLVHAVVDGIKDQRAPEELVGELEPALEEEAKVLVKKVWRLVVFLSESEGRGLN